LASFQVEESKKCSLLHILSTEQLVSSVYVVSTAAFTHVP